MTGNRVLSSSLLLLLALPLGCAKGDSQATPPAGSSSTAAAQAPTPTSPSASAKQERHGREHAGPAGTIFRAARDLELTDAQKTTIDGLESQLEGAEPPNDDFKTLQADIVTGIRAGKLDPAKLQTDYAAIDKTLLAQQAKEADALSGLYAALEPAQRKTLVEAVRAKQAAREAQFDAHLAGDAGAPAEWTKRRLDRMTAQLGLDATEQPKVAAILAKDDSMSPAAMRVQRDEGKKRMDAVLGAFAADKFDPKTLDLGAIPGKTAHEGLEKDTKFLAQLLPILTPEQREKLAVQRDRDRMRGARHGGADDPHWGGHPAGGPPPVE
jgi:Spy/CpxP family protein refolding chaperone